MLFVGRQNQSHQNTKANRNSCRKLNFKTEHLGGMNAEYRQKFPKLHKGMIEINGLPNFSFVYIHIGNNFRQTAGCPVCGFGFDYVDGDYQIVRSKDAY